MERRNRPQPGMPALVSKGADLPVDYLKMVNEVFTTHFDAHLKVLAKEKRKGRFSTSGRVYPNEIMLSVSLTEEGLVTAMTAHASADFDPTASAPTAEEVLATCVDALASLYSDLLPAEKPEKILGFVEASLVELEGVPLVWTPMTVNKRQTFLVVDKVNPDLEKMTDKWLQENDPNYLDELEREELDDEELMNARLQSLTGSTKKGGDSGPIRH